MSERLQDKRAIVTGASRGIGEAIARAYAAEGAQVIITSRKQEVLDAVAASINADHPDRVVPVACHMGKLEQLDALLDRCEQEGGLPDILVNNAATNPYFGPMIGIEGWAFDKTFEVNLRGPFELTRKLAERWMAASRPGTVVNVASIAGLGAAPLQGVYGMSKAALISMTRTFAVELGPSGIRVNALAPGLVDTHFAQALIGSEDIVKIYTDRTALHRYGLPQEIAPAAVFLGSDESAYMSGQTVCVDGGYSIA